MTSAKLTPDLGSQGHLWSEKMSLRHGWGWYPPQTTSYILIIRLQSVWAIVKLSQEHTVAPLYRYYTSKISPRFGNSGSLVEWKWCHNLMLEADIHLRLLQNIHIRHIQSVWAIGMLSQGNMGAPLHHDTGQVGPRFGKSGSLEGVWCTPMWVKNLKKVTYYRFFNVQFDKYLRWLAVNYT